MVRPIVLVAGEFRGVLSDLGIAIEKRGWQVVSARDLDSISDTLAAARPDAVVVGSVEFASGVRQKSARIPLVLAPLRSSEQLAIAALRLGVTEYLREPAGSEEICAALARWLSPRPHPCQNRIVGTSAGIAGIRSYIQKVAPTTSTVLITGETGTGKELVAEAIHSESDRARGPFVCINCAAVPDTLLESELFGYERGAFTGAQNTRDGLLVSAHGGTVFLDEIGEMTPYSQAKILRALESRRVQRVGSGKDIQVNIRVIAATNQNLEELMSAGKFRKDLYFRLNVARLHLPPLNERKEDIPALCQHYITEFNRRFQSEVSGMNREVLDRLVQYHWPGNIRELRNVMEVVFIGGPGQTISVDDLPDQFRKICGAEIRSTGDERERLIDALSATEWNCTKAAQKLHWSRMTLYRKMAKFGVAKSQGAA